MADQQYYAQQQQQQQQQTQAADPAQAALPPPTTRWSWANYPSNRIDGTRMVVPLGCLYTPLAVPAPTLPYAPLQCVKCQAALNPHCSIDYRGKTWGCVFCGTRNAFPGHYAQMTEQHIPMELMRQYDTVEYAIPEARAPPSYVLVVDTCVDTDEELQGLREYLLLAVERLPPQCNVCLITYGATVQIHELSGACDFPRSVVLRGSVEVTAASLQTLVKDTSRFLCPLSAAEFTLTSLIEDLQRDLWPIPKDHRPLRATGAAISAAASILETSAIKVGSCILAFLSGICTEGPGQSVECSRVEMIRGHADIRDTTPTAKFWEKACGFYDTIMRRIVHNGHSLNVFSAALDQTGVAEMKAAIQASGGMIIAADSWRKQPFRTSLNKYFERTERGELSAGLNVTFDVITSPTWKVMGVIGECIGTGKRSPSVAETEVGFGGTCQWTTSLLQSSCTFAIYFETAQAPPERQSPQSNSYRFVQFITTYQATNGEKRVKVTTLPHAAQAKTDFAELSRSFDQEAAAVLLARMAIHRTDSMPLFDVLRWLDRTAIRLVARFGDYQKDVPQSLRLPPNFTMFPSFMYHLRRSAYLQVFNSSPDETAILRVLLLRAGVAESVIMVHPTLHSYTMQAQPTPALLDSSSLLPDNVLLLDTFFEVLIHHGETIAAWRRAGYENMEGYEYFRAFCDGVRSDARALVEGRYPTPRLIEVNSKDPDARILYNRINPSRTHKSEQQYGNNPGELMYTDDASLQVFMDHLKKLAVQQS